MANTVATTILQQLGGKRFSVMTGAHSFTSEPNALTFKVPSTMTKNRIMAVKITLDANDTYTVNFYTMKRTKGILSVNSTEHTGIYEDMLVSLFEEQTGLATKL